MIGFPLNKVQRLGKILVRMGALSKENLQSALTEQQISNKPLGTILMERGFASEDALAKAIGAQVDVRFVEDPISIIEHDVVKLIPETLAWRTLSIPIKLTPDGLQVAMTDPLNFIHIDDLGYASNCRILPLIATRSKILSAIDTVYKSLDSVNDLIEGIEMDHVEVIGQEAVDLEKILESDIDAPIVKLVNLLLLEAIKQDASDVHIEPTQNLLRVRYRVDGILREALSPPKKTHAAACSRIKILAGLDIAEHRIPQDGRALIRTREGIEMDMRVNVVPTIYGERVEIRLLRQNKGSLNVHNMGMNSACLSQFLELINRPSGLVLVVGPTGSGKTTTLYSALNELDSSSQHIITVEDPVEYRMEGVTQIQVNLKTGMTFSQSLRAVLRQDPNTILLGEIRDKETADIAIEAALTGHLVFSTVHSTDAAHTVMRLKTLGIDPYIASSSLAGIMSTRLVRRLCEHCRIPYQPKPEIAGQLGKIPGGFLFKAGGCVKCRQTGYKGRIGIYELVPIDQRLQDVIQGGASVTEMQDALVQMDFRTLWVDGLEKMVAGLTTFDELLRVTRNYMAGPKAK